MHTMIWDSPILMSIIDILVVAIVLLTVLAFRRLRHPRAQARLGSTLLLLGLILVGAFYGTDFVVLLASGFGQPESIALLKTLHLNVSWAVIPIGTAMTVAGFVLILVRLRETVDSLERSERRRAEQRVVLDETADALRHAEIRFERLVEIAPQAIITVDRRQRIETFNRAAEQIFGYASEEIRGAPLERLLPERIRSRHHAHVTAFANSPALGRRMNEGGKVFGLRKDGTEFPAEASIVKFESDGETVLAVMLQDITEREHRDAELRHAQRMEAAGQLTGGVAHDFNNLLLAISGNLELLQERLQHRNEHDLALFASRALEAVDRGAALTKRLLAFSRKQILNPQVIDLNQLVSGLTDLLRRTLGETIDLEVVTAGGLWPCEVDPSEIETALLNLAINARDAMPKGGKLTIETANARLDDEYAAAHEEVAAGQYVMLAVTDTGSGMPPEVVERAFEPFFTTKRPGEGTGLGLSMVYGLVKQSRGHVKIYSEMGQGTTVKVYLPRARGVVDSVEDKTREEAHPSGQGEKILVVEDDPTVREMTVDLLRDLDYEVVDAIDAQSALQRLDEHPDVDLLFTDVVLPGGRSGADLAREARQRRPGLKVLFTSGYTDNAIVHHGRLDDGAELIEKPFRKEALARKLRALLETRGEG